MTPEQRSLARTGLGLPNDIGRSTRSRMFYASPSEGLLWTTLTAMAEAGLMSKSRTPVVGSPTIHSFTLTRAGAERALDDGERLDPLHFPPIGAH